MATIALERVTKRFAEGQAAVRDLDLAVEDGEFIVLVGPSGCGKSTTLRLIAGLESPTAGRILIDGRDVTAATPQERDLAMVFQSYALYPHRTVGQNLAFGLRMRRVGRDEIERRVRDAATALGIEDLLDRRPAQLSGGQRQRVALGRAIVREPRAFLFDEPLSNLDPALRAQARAELTLLHRRLGATMVHVTHDQEEAMTLGDRVAVLREGELQQYSEPAIVYRQPANVFVARFIGSPEMNFFEATVTTEGDRAVIEARSFAIPAAGPALRNRESAGREVVAGIRPHDIAIVAEEAADVNAVIQLVEMLGSAALVHAHVADHDDEADRLVRVMAPPDTPLRAGARIGLRLDPDALHLFDRRSELRIG